MWQGIAIVEAGVILALAFFVVYLLVTGKTERMQLYDRLQAGTLRDYAAVEEIRRERQEPTAAGGFIETEEVPEYEPPAVDMQAADTAYHKLVG